MASLATIIENLARAQRDLLRAADAVPADEWNTSPAEGRWSAGELIGHLSAVERAILNRTDKLLQKPPKPVPFFKRFHVPMIIVEARVIRRRRRPRLNRRQSARRKRCWRNCAECGSGRWRSSKRQKAATSVGTTWGIRSWGH